MEARASALVSVANRRDALTEELEAMAAIGHVLDNIADLSVRQRVLDWAAYRFQAQKPPVIDPSDAIRVDPALAVDSLDDICVGDRQEPHDGLKLVIQTRPPVESTLRSFVADFQRLAKDWHDV